MQDQAIAVRGKSSLATQSLDHDISLRPDFALLSVRLRPGQKILAEPSAMATMSPTLELKAGMRGGVGRSIGRMLGGESLIVNTFTAKHGAGELDLAPASPGDVMHYRLQGNSLMLQRDRTSVG